MMSFLDNLENNLKALESQDQGGGVEDHKRREAERELALAAAPWAERLKKSGYAETLMRQATRAGYPRRMKINLSWMGAALRLEALGQKLELRPAPDGVNAWFLGDGQEGRRVRVDLGADPQGLVSQWMEVLDSRKKLEEERIARISEGEPDEQ